MSNLRNKFFVFQAYLLAGGVLAYMKLLEMKNQALYKSSVIFHTAMEKLKSHPGAIHYLGEPITDGLLTILKVEKEEESNTRKYQVKVSVKGSKANGNMIFWLRHREDDDDGDLYRIELYIEKIQRGLLIMKKSNLTSTSE